MPTDTTFLSTLTIKREGKRKDTTFYAMRGNEMIGWVSVYVPSAVSEDLDTYDEDDNDWYVDCVDVKSEYQRKGVATFLYDHMKKVFGYVPADGTYRTPDGKAFREALYEREVKAYAAARAAAAA